MHVDDGLYADVGDHLEHTICTSVGALFSVLGPPDNPLVPSPLSTNKFEAFYNYERKLVGRHFDSRRLTVGMLPYKRAQLSDTLREWLVKKSYQLLDIATLLGVLENHTRYARWARCWFFALQNAVRQILRERYHIVSRIFSSSARRRQYRHDLPPSLACRIEPLLSRDRAQLLWATRQKFTVTPEMKVSLEYLHHYVQDMKNPWETPLGMIIPRRPHFWS